MRKKKKKPFGLALFAGLGVLASVLTFQMYHEAEAKAPSIKMKSQKPHLERSYDVSGKSFVETVKLGAIGDILIHDTVYEDAFVNPGYDFKPMLSNVKEYLIEPDLLLANQETLLGGVEIGLSSYPMFNSPVEVGEAFIDAGVDIVSNANNHSLDKSEKGVMASIKNMEAAGLPYVGSYKDDADQQKLRILNKNGINVSYLSYTYGTNGIPVPIGKDHLVNLIDREAMKAEIHRAKAESDVVVMSIHWGNEYQRFPTTEQEDLAQFLVDEGVDIIFGHHPHVLQPMDWLTATDGRKALVVYSLGNFLSGQMWDYKDIGGLATVEITKTITPEGNEIVLNNPEFIPTFVSSSRQRNYQVVPLQEAGKFGLAGAENKYNEIMHHMTQFIKE
ncbi:CapA family protein [Bacillus sp. ISL-37]|jgi:poly-gamma-glutamate capsule biosynthesis protein CapA/YwtB (metallophosphatase superfamily)|uniref:CapA family protein n=1 Tax=Bacillus sp. ISL-37 TaxID=2819123 RepID=UPI001BE78693|nr:CapA family protein [Bacillus sp. ISL-37]MBT2684916.1 CapA family protein [Bacillus sp. ISL-37]